MSDVTAIPVDQASIDIGDMRLWENGFPHAVFERLRQGGAGALESDGDVGERARVLVGHPRRGHPRDQPRVGEPSPRSGAGCRNVTVARRWSSRRRCSSRWIRHGTTASRRPYLQRGFTPKRIAEHEAAIRAIVDRVLRLDDREEIDVVADIASPVVSRVIGSFVGTPEEDDAGWSEEFAVRAMAFGDEGVRARRIETVMEQINKVFEDGGRLVAERRASPTDDLTSILATAEIDGEGLSDEEILMGFALLQLAGNDSTKATFSNGMLALLRNPEQKQKLIDDPSKAEAAVEEILRMFPAFAHFRRTATRDVEFRGKQIREGDKVVMWYPSSNRDEAVYECPHQLDVERHPDHQAFGAGGRHFRLGTALARLELKILLEETLRRWPDMELIDGEPPRVQSLFINQPLEVRVRLRGAAPA